MGSLKWQSLLQWWVVAIIALIAIHHTIMVVQAAIVCSPDVLAARVGTIPLSLPVTPTIDTAKPWFAPLACEQSTFYPQSGEGTYVVGFNVTDECSGNIIGITTSVVVTCSNPLPSSNITIEWVWNPTTISMRLIGTISSCYNVANAFWQIISSPYGSLYTNGQLINKISNGPSYYSIDITPTIIGYYSLQLLVYDNCAVYYRNITLLFDGNIIHVLPPISSHNGISASCDAILSPIIINNTPLKSIIWNGINNNGISYTYTSSLHIRESSGTHDMIYQWLLNQTDYSYTPTTTSAASVTYTSTSSAYQFGNLSINSQVISNRTFPISSQTLQYVEPIKITSSPLSILHIPFAGTPSQGMFIGTIKRSAYHSIHQTTTTTIDESIIQFNSTITNITYVDQTCLITLDWHATNSNSVNMTIATSIPTGSGAEMFHWPYITSGSKCVGTYMLSVRAKDITNCSSHDYDWLMIDCGPAPQPILSPCDASIISFQFSSRTFLWRGTNPLDASLSRDPYSPSRQLLCCYQFTAVPAASALYGTVHCIYCDWVTQYGNNPSPKFDVPGTYSVTLHVSNYCSKSSVTHTYTAICDTSSIMIASIDPSTSQNYTSDGSNYGQIITFISTSNTSASLSPVNGYLTYEWSALISPTMPSWLWSPFVSTPSAEIYSPTSDTTIVVAYLAGTYVMQLRVTHGCQQYATATQSFHVTCLNDLTAVVPASYSTTDTCEIVSGGTWTEQTVTGTYTRTVPQTTNNLAYNWIIVSAPAGAVNTINVESNVGNNGVLRFTPDVAGAYVWKFQAYDFCQVSESTITITAILQPVVIPSIAITPTPSTATVNYGNSISLVASGDVTWISYYWNITTYPTGIIPSLSTSTIIGSTSNAIFHGSDNGIYIISVTITTTCGAKKTQSISLTVNCPYPLVALAQASVSGSGNASSTSVVTWPESNIWRQVTLNGTATAYGSRWITNVTADWVVTSAPLDSIWAPVVNTTYSYNTIDNVINSTFTRRSIRSYTTVTKTWAHISPSSFAPLEACFQPDMPGIYTIEMRITDGCQASVAVVTVQAACSAPPVAIITRRGSLPPTFGSTSQVASSVDTTLQSTQPPSDGTRMFLDASPSYSTQKGATLSYYWTWLSPSSIAGSSTGIDPQYGPKILLSSPYPSNSTLILYVSDGCTISTARLLVSCGSDVSPSLSSLAVSASVDPYSRTIPEFVLSTSTCYPQEATKWHLVSYTPTLRDFTMEAQATKINGVSSRYQSVGAMMIASVAVVIAMIFNW